MLADLLQFRLAGDDVLGNDGIVRFGAKCIQFPENFLSNEFECATDRFVLSEVMGELSEVTLQAGQFFGDVRAGEGATVLLMSLNVFLLLVAYYILKTVREPLILMAGGAELKSYASAAQALTLIAYVPLYGWLATRLASAPHPLIAPAPGRMEDSPRCAP